ncbi:top2 [Symbiodinium sp. CCMP2592]|nr:top2 [Symbiodinium sp. CCMP2592]
MAREAVSGEFHLECQVRVSAERAVASPKLRAPSVVGEVVMEEAEALDKDTQHSTIRLHVQLSAFLVLPVPTWEAVTPPPERDEDRHPGPPNISTTNMWLFDVDGKIQKYDNPEDIIQAFFPVRYQIYERRKAYLVDKLERELAVLSNKLRFVELVVGDRLDVEKKRMVDLCGKMRKLGLEHMCQIKGEGSVKVGTEEEAGPDGFKYLLSMKLWSLTENKVEEGVAETPWPEGTSIEALWEADLQRLEHALDECDEKDRKEAEAAERLAAKNMSDESFLVNKQCVLVLGRNFTAKRVRTSEWKARRRGGGFSSKRLVSKAEALNSCGEDFCSRLSTPLMLHGQLLRRRSSKMPNAFRRPISALQTSVDVIRGDYMSLFQSVPLLCHPLSHVRKLRGRAARRRRARTTMQMQRISGTVHTHARLREHGYHDIMI